MIGSVGSSTYTSPYAQAAALPSRQQPEALSPEEQKQVDELKRRDAEVRAHERAHVAAGAGLIQGGASYQFTRGPDGKSYAVGGEVSIDVSPGKTPQETIRKAQQIRAAALAPQDPSGQDRAVAAQAMQLETQARLELSRENGKLAGKDGSRDAAPAGSRAEPSYSVRQALQRYGGSQPATGGLSFSATA